MGLGSELVILAIGDGGPKPRFSPELAYALATAELVDLAVAGRLELRGERLVVVDSTRTGEAQDDDVLRAIGRSTKRVTMPEWLAERGPWRIDAYVKELVAAGVVRVEKLRPRSADGAKTIRIRDADRFARVEERLLRVCDSTTEPTVEELAFAVLARLGKCADAHVRGWGNRARRARLRNLVTTVLDSGDPAIRLLGACIPEIHRLALVAPERISDTRTIDEQIGLSPAGRTIRFWGR